MGLTSIQKFADLGVRTYVTLYKNNESKRRLFSNSRFGFKLWFAQRED